LLAASQSPQTTDVAGAPANVSCPSSANASAPAGIVFERAGTRAIVITEIKEMKKVTVKGDEG
jgi:hypothetical protein